MKIEDLDTWHSQLDGFSPIPMHGQDIAHINIEFAYALIRQARKVPELEALYEKEHKLVLVLDARIDTLRSERDAAQMAVSLLNSMVKCGEDHSDVSTAIVRKALHRD